MNDDKWDLVVRELRVWKDAGGHPEEVVDAMKEAVRDELPGRQVTLGYFMMFRGEDGLWRRGAFYQHLPHDRVEDDHHQLIPVFGDVSRLPGEVKL